MKKTGFLLLIFLLVVSCSQKIAEPSSGKSLGVVYVSSHPGTKSIFVRLDDMWRVISKSDWISLDVNGGKGMGAFTMHYTSNESDFSHSNPTRKGSIVIENLSTMVADTLYLVQQGVPDGEEYADLIIPSYIEFEDAVLKRMKLLYANVQGCDEGDICSFLASTDARIIGLILDPESEIDTDYPCFTYGNTMFVNKGESAMNVVAFSDSPVSLVVDVDGIKYQISDFNEQISEPESRYAQAKNMLDIAYNIPGNGDRWFIGGSLYYYSVMEMNYPDTPSWYPTDPHSRYFDADLYVQTNNLLDCVWSSSRHFNSTFSCGGNAWRADYIYASNSAWNATVKVSLIDEAVPGASHKSLEIIMKY